MMTVTYIPVKSMHRDSWRFEIRWEVFVRNVRFTAATSVGVLFVFIHAIALPSDNPGYGLPQFISTPD
jgi:hypothetical protein